MSGFSLFTAAFLALTAVVGALAAGTWDNGPATGRLTGNEPAAVDTPPAVFGRPAAVGGLRLTLSNPRPGWDLVPDPVSGDGATVELVARSENPTGRKARNPDVEVYCADGRGGGRYAQSRWKPDAALAAGSFMEGRLVLGVPLGCADPEVRAADWHRHWEIDTRWPLPLDMLSATPLGRD